MIDNPDENDHMADGSDDGDEVQGFYGIEICTRAGLIPYDSDGFIDEYKGEVCFYEDFADATSVGEFRATVVRSEDAREAGISLFDLWDHSHDLHQLYCSLFNPKTDEFKPTIERRFQTINRSVLSLDLIAIRPAHRGKNLGLAVASRLIDVLGRGCDLVVCMPSPMQFGPMAEEDPAKAKKLALDTFDTDRDKAFRRIRRYWGQLGFKRLGKDQDYYALSLHLFRPRIQTLCQLL